MGNNSVTTLAEVASKPMPLSDHGRFAYWDLNTHWASELANGERPMDWQNVANYHALTREDRNILVTAYKRVYAKWQLTIALRRTRAQRNVALMVYACLKHRKYLRTYARKYEGRGLQHFIELVRNQYGDGWVIDTPSKEVRRELGKFFRKREKNLLQATLPAPREPQYHDKLPLYACSGELEADGLRHGYYRPDGRYVSNSGKTNYRKQYWNVGRDGGGQHEIRFLIAHRLTDTACGLVHRLGSTARNGGHIHINCKRDEEIGQSVFYALRYHLSWFRYLAPLTRRRSRWCNVHDTGSWGDALNRKYAAVSANTFLHTGTVEVRLWPTSRRAEEWRFRASLMRAVAKWAEDNTQRDCETPISNETAVQAWESFYRWAAIHEPETLKAILRAMKAKTRTIGSRSGTADRFGAAKCDEFVRQFDATDIRLRGYRRAVRQPVTAVCSTDQ